MSSACRPDLLDIFQDSEYYTISRWGKIIGHKMPLGGCLTGNGKEKMSMWTATGWRETTDERLPL